MSAETLATELVKVVFQKLADEAFKRYVRSQGIHNELKELKRTLSSIQDLLIDASQKEATDKTVRSWLNDLKHLAYDIDDVLDDVATEAMHHELTPESGASTSKVRKLIPTCCTNFSLSHRLSPKLDSINKELEHLEKRKKGLGLIKKDEKPKNTSKRIETSLPEPDVVGREVEKEKLRNKLLGDDRSSKEKFSVVPIVGMGGVGKTTLARLLYNDTKVKGHFEPKAWVCVSDDFDIFKISDTILQSVTREKKEYKDLNLLQLALKEQFMGKRFLLVVDDVWHEDDDDWENLVRPFRSCASGSRIIMTTRNNRLLKKLGFDNLDRLESLSHEDALSLFALHALDVDNFDSHPTFKQYGEDIVKKCAGLPLALKAIGRLLRTKTSGEDWDEVLNSEVWNLEISDKIVPALMLSYFDLSTDLKQLFAYCSLFPKDFLFDKDELVLLWMAEGFLNPTNAIKSSEHLGHEYFEILLSRSFFQHAPNERSMFMMHDLMNDLATFVAREFFLRLENHTEARKEDLEKHRHMSFIREKYVGYQKFEAFKQAKSLRTFLAVSAGVAQNQYDFFLSNKILVDLLPKLTLLRVLSLSYAYITEVPEFIGSFKYLRYLNLAGTSIEELPENICNLYNLQTLIVFSCRQLTKLPKSFSKLKKLRHFDIRDTPLLEKLPLGIGELESLQTLSKIIIGGDDGFAITELKGLKNLLGKFSIEGLHRVPSAMHAREANLSLKRITELELNWVDVFDDSRRVSLEKEVLNELKPHNNTLESIQLKSYGGIEFPNWIGDPSFFNLVHVSIIGCKKCTSLPSLGKLPSLKKLLIQGLDEVKCIGSDLSGTGGVAFPSLEILSFINMLGWEEWSTNNQVFDAMFPCIQEFHIKKCPNLKDISLEALPLLRVLEIDECGDGVLRSLVPASSSVTKLKIYSISGLTYEVWRGVIKYLGAVEEVSIKNCHDIRYLWESEEKASKVLLNLKKLTVESCNNLVSLGEKEEKDNFGSSLLSSLLTLDVLDCHSMERCCCPNSIGIDSLTLSYCTSLTYISFPTAGGGKKLKLLNIYGCDKLVENIASMPNLEKVSTSNWAVLKSVFQLSNFTHLTELHISCLSIESFPDLSLSKLTVLDISICENLKSVFQLSKLIYLTELRITACPCIESFPDLQLSNLTGLSIIRCRNFKSFPNLSNLTMLNNMAITYCPSMVPSFPSGLWPPKLVSLTLGGLKKPISEWGAHNFPTSLTELTLLKDPHVSDFSRLSHIFPSSLTYLEILSFDQLESLSTGLEHLTSLQHLVIDDCPIIKHLPKLLLHSLLRLEMLGCPNLEEMCNGRGSYYWPLISHIPCIKIDYSYL